MFQQLTAYRTDATSGMRLRRKRPQPIATMCDNNKLAAYEQQLYQQVCVGHGYMTDIMTVFYMKQRLAVIDHTTRSTV